MEVRRIVVAVPVLTASLLVAYAIDAIDPTSLPLDD